MVSLSYAQQSRLDARIKSARAALQGLEDASRIRPGKPTAAEWAAWNAADDKLNALLAEQR